MKIIVEVSDDNRKHAIDEIVSKRVAELTQEAITAQVDNILAIKLGRIDSKAVDAALERSTTAIVNQILGSNEYMRSNRISTMVSAEVLKLIRASR